jgi:predicted HicB family RNase H-like nuclease
MADDYEKSISFKIDPDTKTEIRVAAAEQDTSMSEWVREAIQQKLERGGDSENRSPADPVLAD